MSCQHDNVLSLVTLTPKGTLFRDVLTELFRLRAVMLDSAERLTAPVGLTSARWQILGAIEDAPRRSRTSREAWGSRARPSRKPRTPWSATG